MWWTHDGVLPGPTGCSGGSTALLPLRAHFPSVFSWLDWWVRETMVDAWAAKHQNQLLISSGPYPPLRAGLDPAFLLLRGLFTMFLPAQLHLHLRFSRSNNDSDGLKWPYQFCLLLGFLDELELHQIFRWGPRSVSWNFIFDDIYTIPN